MDTIRVNASTEYEVLIENGLLARLGTLARGVCGGEKALIVTDDTVRALYAQPVRDALSGAGFETEIFAFPAGESSKTLPTWERLLETLAALRFSRPDLIVALGGGTVSDLAGFAAATYLRGIDWLAVPTTLLAMTDASVGGKTGLDLDTGKNLVGAFYQPKLVVCDPETLKTLPQPALSDGFAEVIKYGMIGDSELLTLLHGDFAPQAEQIISRCIRQKAALVQQDERDCGIRRLLNFGHTVGHAIETVSEYRISHGKAVAIGMAAMTKLSEHTGECADGIYWELCDLLTKYGLPTRLPYDAQTLYEASLSDKKRQDGTLALVLPMRRGQCRIRECPTEDYRAMLERLESL